MRNKEMSAVQQRTKKLQQIISETSSFDDAKLQQAFTHQIYDSEGRQLSFLKIFSRQYGSVSSHHDKLTSPKSSNSVRTSESSDATASSRKHGSTEDSNHVSKTLSDSPRRVLVIFIRHFLCGLCQEYLARLSTHPSLSRANLTKHNITVAIVGCGSPTYIPSYRVLTNLPEEWGLYADPSTELYRTLAMHRSMSMGDRRPIYIQRTMTGTMLRSIVQGVRRVPKGDAGRGGSWDVNGGEFLFEEAGSGNEVAGSGSAARSPTDEWQLKWCHRMENSRDHTEVEDLIAVAGLTSTPSSPTTATTIPPNDVPLKVHNRSYSTPLNLQSVPTSIANDDVQSHGPIKRQFSLRRTLSSRRQSWLGRSDVNTAGSCSKPGGGCLANARARELL